MITLLSVSAVQQLQKLTITIVSPETEKQAREQLTAVRLHSKQLKAEVAALKKPHQDAVKAITDAAKPWQDFLDERDRQLENGVLVYQRKVREAVEAANRKAMERFEKKVEKAETKAIENGTPMPLVVPPAMANAPAKTVSLELGKQTVVKRKAWRLSNRAINAGLTPETMTALDNTVNEGCIPLEYFILDTAKIGKVVRAGGNIPGIDVYEEESIAVKA